MRQTRIGMIVIGLAFWIDAIALPGMHVAILVFAGALVAWAVHGLLAK